jgi:hypothetical protein
VPIEMLKNQRFLEPEETAVLSEVFDDVVKRLRIVDRQDVLRTNLTVDGFARRRRFKQGANRSAGCPAAYSDRRLLAVTWATARFAVTPTIAAVPAATAIARCSTKRLDSPVLFIVPL